MKQNAMRKFVLSLPAAAVIAATATWSTGSLACSSEPYIGSICIMAWPKTASFGNSYVAANGTTLNIAQYQALFAVIGVTYGGNGSSTFQLPDLRGRKVIGVGTNPNTGLTYNYGQSGNGTTTLTAAQLPAHTHTLNAGSNKPATATATIGTLSATTTLTGLTATTSLSGVTATASASNLVLKGYSGTAGTGTPTGAALATPTGPANKIYTSTTPDVAMASGSITGTAPVTFTGNPTTQITGNPSTTLSGAPAVTIGGTTDVAGTSQAVSTLPPYLAMSYYIAVNGLYPSID